MPDAVPTLSEHCNNQALFAKYTSYADWINNWQTACLFMPDN